MDWPLAILIKSYLRSLGRGSRRWVSARLARWPKWAPCEFVLIGSPGRLVGERVSLCRGSDRAESLRTSFRGCPLAAIGSRGKG